MTYKKVFSYYGGKSKIAHKYPVPIHDIIIEPFAGGAAYSLAHCERQVILNDKNPLTSAAWEFLVRPDASTLIHQFVPTSVKHGDHVDDLVDIHACPPGLINIIRAELNQGTLGAEGYRAAATPWAERDWHQVLKRLDYWVPKIAHWVVESCDYTELPNLQATWFVDPPYNNAVGHRYQVSDVDYSYLAQWCQNRKGQTIVCENEGATWLPFEPFSVRAGCYSGRDERAKASGVEVVWYGTQ